MDRLCKRESEMLYDNKVEIKHIEPYYKFVEDNIKIYKNLHDAISLSTFWKFEKYSEIAEFKKIIDNEFDSDNAFFEYMSIFILKAFNKGAIDLSRENVTLFSNEIINKIKTEMDRINIFIRLKKNMEHKNIEKSEKFILKLLTELENKKIIESKTIYIAKNMSEKILSIKNMKISIQIDVNKKPFEIIKFATNEYQISVTYNTIRDLKTTNIQTNRINTTNSNLAVISKMINRKIYIDIEILSEIYREFIKENNIADNIEEYYKEMLTAYSKFINEDDKISIKKNIQKNINI